MKKKNLIPLNIRNLLKEHDVLCYFITCLTSKERLHITLNIHNTINI